MSGFQLRENLKYYKISSDDLCTLEKIEKPSDSLHLLYQALGILQDHPSSSYEYGNALSNLQQTKHFIETFGPRPIPQSTLIQLQPYVQSLFNSDFSIYFYQLKVFSSHEYNQIYSVYITLNTIELVYIYHQICREYYITP